MKEFFDFDKFNLDEEWVKQPALYHEYATKLANARADVEELKAALELKEAELYTDIRARPSHYDLDPEKSPTEGMVRNTIIMDTGYQESLKRLNDKKREMGQFSVAVETLDHRKYALQNEVQLFLANYFSKPQAPEGARERLKKLETSKAFSKKGKSNHAR